MWHKQLLFIMFFLQSHVWAFFVTRYYHMTVGDFWLLILKIEYGVAVFHHQAGFEILSVFRDKATEHLG